METKSSLRRIVWSLVYVSLAFGGLRLATGQGASQASGSPQRERTVVRRRWRVEPVKIIAVKNKKKANIEITKPFDDDDDWLDGFTVTVTNIWNQPITAVTIEMIFRREVGDTRPPVAQPLHFGLSPFGPEYTLRDPNKVIKVGETAELHLIPENYQILKGLLVLKGYPTAINKVELQIREVGFEDGSAYLSGGFWLPDPNSPNDPTRRIPAPRSTSTPPPSARPPGRIGSKFAHSSLRTRSNLSADAQDWDCWSQGSTTATECVGDNPSLRCGVLVDHRGNDSGAWDTEVQTEGCELMLDGTYFDCSVYAGKEVARFFECTVPCGQQYDTCVMRGDCCSGLYCDGGQCATCDFAPACNSPLQSSLTECCCVDASGNCQDSPILIDTGGMDLRSPMPRQA
jgi:hypothetical protein